MPYIDRLGGEWILASKELKELYTFGRKNYFADDSLYLRNKFTTYSVMGNGIITKNYILMHLVNISVLS